MKCPKCQADNPDTQRFCGECGTQLTPSEELPISHTKTLETPAEELRRGTTFAGRYEIIEELGKGGMGAVYRVEDKKIGQEVALKLIKPEIASDKKTITRFSNELKTARMISHRNVCRMFELMEAEGTHFITMEYVPGEDLKSLIRRVRRLDVGTAISISKQICEGLVEAHRLGVIHRDLKPSNIMIDKEGSARIMDFGIARSLKAEGITGEGVIIGTPEYMSPEQVEAREVDQRSDIYSLGVILYEMVTGQLPFKGDTPLSIALKHKSEVPKDPRELNPQITEDLSLLILKCLEKDRENRYQSADELHSALTNIEKGIPITDRIVPKKPITSREITLTFGIKKLIIPALVIVTIAVMALVLWRLLIKKEPVPIPEQKASVAVLPFVNLSPQENQEYLCDGLAESIINALSKIKELRVPARASSFLFKSKERDIREIGQRLSVEAVLDGSLQRVGNRIRITAQLIDVADESLLWSEQFNRELDDIFEIQDKITLSIVDKLKVSLMGREGEALTKRHTESTEAYQAYQKGMYFWSKRTTEDNIRGIEYFQEALEHDPNFALAYVGLANSYITLSPIGGPITPEEGISKAKAAALKALDIDSTLGEAHAALAFIYFTYERNWEEAEKEFKQAIDLNPGYATAHQWYSDYLLVKERFEDSLNEVKRANELDPLSPIVNYYRGDQLYYMRRYDQALEEINEMLEMFPNFGPGYNRRGLIYLQKGKCQKAIKEIQKAETLTGSSGRYLGSLGYAYATCGYRDKALRALEELTQLAQQRHVRPLDIAGIYAGLQNKDRAFEWIEKAYKARTFHVLLIKLDPVYDSLQSDPRFQELLRKIGLEK